METTTFVIRCSNSAFVTDLLSGTTQTLGGKIMYVIKNKAAEIWLHLHFWCQWNDNLIVVCLEIVAIRCRNFIFWNVFLGDGCHLAEILFWHLFWDENPRKMCCDDLEKEKSVLVAISSSNILLSIWGFFFKCFSWWKSNLYLKSLASC